MAQYSPTHYWETLFGLTVENAHHRLAVNASNVEVNIKSISSRDNSLVVTLNKLRRQAKERRQRKQTILDGAHLISAYLDAGNLPQAIVIRDDVLQKPEITKFVTVATQLVCLPSSLYEYISPVKTPSGILALIDIPVDTNRHTKDFFILLEDIQDPGNLGMIIRSAAAAGADQIFLSKNCADAWSPKVLRAAMGGHFALAIHEDVDLAPILSNFSGNKIATSLRARRSIYELDLTGPIALVFGNEGVGISEKLLSLVDLQALIPMPGKMESLNIAAAASICCFERVRQLGVSNQSI